MTGHLTCLLVSLPWGIFLQLGLGGGGGVELTDALSRKEISHFNSNYL